jgi:hypothetical protein
MKNETSKNVTPLGFMNFGFCVRVEGELDVWKFEPFDWDLEGSLEQNFEDEWQCHLSSLVIYNVIRNNSMKYLIPNTILPLTYYG